MEIGCNEGKAGALLQCIMDKWEITDKKLYLYDSFEGLPAPKEVDGEGALIREGAFAVDEEVVLKTFLKFDLKLPVICKGWFCDTLSTQLPDKICFAYLDGDLYESIRDSLKYVYPRMSKGAIALIDDYWLYKKKIPELAFPGVRKACDEFLAEHHLCSDFFRHQPGGQAFFRKEA